MMRSPRVVKNSFGLFCLNAGCGDRFLADWVNLDFIGRPGVSAHDMRNPLPFEAGCFDVVYSSHVIEHFDVDQARTLVAELHRVLKPNGICRILTPDLELMVREYLKYLEQWEHDPSTTGRQRSQWILLEMFDQMTRRQSGGKMRAALQQGDYDAEYVVQRNGDEMRTLLGAINQPRLSARKKTPVDTIMDVGRALRNRLMGRCPRCAFLDSGELHQWYYDRMSLTELLTMSGFTDVKKVDYLTSSIPHWDHMNLDLSQYDAGPRKPDSLVMEGRKPSVGGAVS